MKSKFWYVLHVVLLWISWPFMFVFAMCAAASDYCWHQTDQYKNAIERINERIRKGEYIGYDD